MTCTCKAKKPCHPQRSTDVDMKHEYTTEGTRIGVRLWSQTLRGQLFLTNVLLVGARPAAARVCAIMKVLSSTSNRGRMPVRAGDCCEAAAAVVGAEEAPP